MPTLTHTVDSLWRILLAGVLIGAGLPAIFAVGVRLSVVAERAQQQMLARAGAWLCYLTVLAVIVVGILFIMRDFLARDIGLHLF